MVTSLTRSIDRNARPVHNRLLIGRRGIAPSCNLVQCAPAPEATPVRHRADPNAWGGDGLGINRRRHWRMDPRFLVQDVPAQGPGLRLGACARQPAGYGDWNQRHVPPYPFRRQFRRVARNGAGRARVRRQRRARHHACARSDRSRAYDCAFPSQPICTQRLASIILWQFPSAKKFDTAQLGRWLDKQASAQNLGWLAFAASTSSAPASLIPRQWLHRWRRGRPSACPF